MGKLQVVYRGKKVTEVGAREVVYSNNPVHREGGGRSYSSAAEFPPSHKKSKHKKLNPIETLRMAKKQKKGGNEDGKSDGTELKKIEMITMEDFIDTPISMCVYENQEKNQMNVIIGLDSGTMILYDITKSKQEPEKYSTIQQLRKWKIHKDSVNVVLPLNDIKSVASCSSDGTINVVSMENSSSIRTLKGHKKQIYKMIYCLEISQLASCGAEKEILLWNPFISTPIARLSGHVASLLDISYISPSGFSLEDVVEKQNLDYASARDVYSTTIQNSSIFLVSLDCLEFLKVWDLKNFKCLQTIACDNTLRSKNTFGSQKLSAIYYNAFKKEIVVADTSLRSFSIKDKKSETRDQQSPEVTNLDDSTGSLHDDHVQSIGHKKPILFMHAVKQINHLITVDSTTAQIWNLDTGESISKFNIEEGVVSSALDTSERKLIVATEKGNIYFYNFFNGQLLKILQKAENVEIFSVFHQNVQVMSEENESLVLGISKNSILRWNVRDTKRTSVFDPKLPTFLTKLKNEISCCAFSRINNCIAIGTFSGVLYLVDSMSGKIRQIAKPTDNGSQNGLNSILNESSTISTLKSKKTNQSQKKGNLSKNSSANYNVNSMDLSIHEQTSLSPRFFRNHDLFSKSYYETIVFLEKKQSLFFTARGNGILTLWSTNDFSQLLSIKSSATYDNVTAMTTDENNNLLIVGDHSGLISIYNISSLSPNLVSSIKMEDVVLENRFRVTETYQPEEVFHYDEEENKKENSRTSNVSFSGAISEHDEKSQYLQTNFPNFLSPTSANAGSPMNYDPSSSALLNGQQHSKFPINSIVFSDRTNTIISGCEDCTVRIHSLEGAFFGMLGVKDGNYKFTSPKSKLPFPFKVKTMPKINTSATTPISEKSSNSPMSQNVTPMKNSPFMSPQSIPTGLPTISPLSFAAQSPASPSKAKSNISLSSLKKLSLNGIGNPVVKELRIQEDEPTPQKKKHLALLSTQSQIPLTPHASPKLERLRALYGNPASPGPSLTSPPSIGSLNPPILSPFSLSRRRAKTSLMMNSPGDSRSVNSPTSLLSPAVSKQKKRRNPKPEALQIQDENESVLSAEYNFSNNSLNMNEIPSILSPVSSPVKDDFQISSSASSPFGMNNDKATYFASPSSASPSSPIGLMSPSNKKKPKKKGFSEIKFANETQEETEETDQKQEQAGEEQNEEEEESGEEGEEDDDEEQEGEDIDDAETDVDSEGNSIHIAFPKATKKQPKLIKTIETLKEKKEYEDKKRSIEQLEKNLGKSLDESLNSKIALLNETYHFSMWDTAEYKMDNYSKHNNGIGGTKSTLTPLELQPLREKERVLNQSLLDNILTSTIRDPAFGQGRIFQLIPLVEPQDPAILLEALTNATRPRAKAPHDRY